MQAEFAKDKVSFVGEQDGPIERQLKEKLVECFKSEEVVEAAYLARVAYPGKTGPQVALCLQMGPARSAELLFSIGEVFKTLFSPKVSLDIIFLSDEQVAELNQVAKPFYCKAS